MDVKLDIRSVDREAIQQTLEFLQDAPKGDVEGFLRYVLNGNRNALQSFVKGAVDNPKTWWIGIFSLQMQMGLFGERLRNRACSNAHILKQILSPLWEDAKVTVFGEETDILGHIVRYAFKYHKAMIIGRFAGGAFTTFASTGGRMGNRHIARIKQPGRTTVVGSAGLTNVVIASYGAAMMSIGLGREKLHDVLFSILTGSDEQMPPHYKLLLGNATMTSEELVKEEWLKEALLEIAEITQVGSGPIPIKEFCSRPENRDDFTDLCK